jgi:pimeloyl-ACP methyl ester carboxylesterase
MSRIALDGITLAVGEWPGPREGDTDKTVVCVHGLSANHTCWASLAGARSPEYRVIAETPEVTSALRAFLAGG